MSAFDGDAAFLAFVGATNQKRIEAEVLRVLISDLAGEDAILAGDAPLELLLPGIGEGSLAQTLAEGLRRSTQRALHLQGNDMSETLAGMARGRLSEDPNIETVDVQTGDAFAPDAISVADMDVVLVSHLLYYAPSLDAARAFVERVIDGLGPNGVAIFLHEAQSSNSAGLRSSYHEGFIAKPTLLVDEVAENVGVPMARVGYPTSFRFPNVEKDAVLDRVAQDGGEAEAPDLTTATSLMQFVFQRSLAELRDEGRLDDAAEAFFAVLDPKTNEFELDIEAQLLPSRRLAADPSAAGRLEACVEKTQSQVAEIVRREGGY